MSVIFLHFFEFDPCSPTSWRRSRECAVSGPGYGGSGPALPAKFLLMQQ